ncbi:MAG: MBL fold metallo-hydrolase, partial [bacterium]|nr:MBL fold metallo-hydrolase [bacterium]
MFEWHGAAHYQIDYQGLKILIDPLYTRLPGDQPHLSVTRDDLDRVDHILLTHAHLDHARDFAYLAAKHDPEIYAPAGCQRAVERMARRQGTTLSASKYHRLEEANGKTCTIADLDVTPYPIGTEEIDLWFLRSMFMRPLANATPSAFPEGFRWLTHHLFGNCFAFHFRFPSLDKTMLYFGNLTEQVDALGGLDSVDVLALPYCPANKNWIQQSRYLIERFRPSVTLVHHFDNFLNPFTRSKYMSLAEYRTNVQAGCPDTRFYFSKFQRQVDFA